jgi:hypothetical protein
MKWYSIAHNGFSGMIGVYCPKWPGCACCPETIDLDVWKKNMRNCLFAVTGLVILLVASNVRGQALWQGTEYGMTLEQAKSHVPEAVRPLKPKLRSDGAEELLRLDDVTLVGKRFSVSFFFSGGKLKEVSLSLEEGHDFQSAMRVFDSLVEHFRAKYGREIIRQTMKGTFSNTANATWLSGQTNITILATSVGGSDATLNVNYSARASKMLRTNSPPSNRGRSKISLSHGKTFQSEAPPDVRIGDPVVENENRIYGATESLNCTRSWHRVI